MTEHNQETEETQVEVTLASIAQTNKTTSKAHIKLMTSMDYY